MSPLADGEVPLPARVAEKIQEHTDSDDRNEVGGVLIGKLVEGEAIIEEALPALEAVGGAAQLTFTHDVWEDLLSTVDRDYPESQIVGWYHSHPGHGIFLSSYDRFIHENFFSAPGMVALVVDPRDDGAFGWFGWRDGELTRLGSALPVDSPDRSEVPREIAAAASARQTDADRMDGLRRDVMLAVAAILVFVAGTWIGARSPSAQLDQRTAQFRQVQAEAADWRGQALRLEGQLAAVCDGLAHAAPADEPSTPSVTPDAPPTESPSPSPSPSPTSSPTAATTEAATGVVTEAQRACASRGMGAAPSEQDTVASTPAPSPTSSPSGPPSG